VPMLAAAATEQRLLVQMRLVPTVSAVIDDASRRYPDDIAVLGHIFMTMDNPSKGRSVLFFYDGGNAPLMTEIDHVIHSVSIQHFLASTLESDLALLNRGEPDPFRPGRSRLLR
jgi:hypothetical protein